MKSLPLSAKVGGSAIVGGGGITGAGLLIHHQLKFKLAGLDAELLKDKNFNLEFDPSSADFKENTNKDEMSVTVKATFTSTDDQFKNKKWTCNIKGIAKSEAASKPDLTQPNQFNKSNQKELFGNKFKVQEANEKRQNLEGFVTSCARNRKENQKTDESWSSELVVNLTKKTTPANSTEYEFSSSAIESIFKGAWENPK